MEREKEISQFQMLQQKAIKDSIEDIVNKPIYELNPDFWAQIQGPFSHEASQATDNSKNILKCKI